MKGSTRDALKKGEDMIGGGSAELEMQAQMAWGQSRREICGEFSWQAPRQLHWGNREGRGGLKRRKKLDWKGLKNTRPNGVLTTPFCGGTAQAQ